ncbi:MAG: NAD(P)-dependent oxidoreductase, partial [Pseudomonadota bacterium]
MSAPRILLHHDATARLAARLAEACPEAELHCCNSYADLPGALAHFRPDIVYAVRFAGSKGYPRAALLGPDGPRWVAVGGAGTDHLGLWETERFIVTNSAGVAAEMMAEYVFGGFLHFTLDVPGLQNDQAARAWNTRKMLRLRGKTLLILGLGHTGQAIARLGRAFGMHVIGTRARPEPMEAVDEVHA